LIFIHEAVYFFAGVHELRLLHLLIKQKWNKKIPAKIPSKLFRARVRSLPVQNETR
jgi:hypothetical protein